jgi:hypothetical protein
MSGRGSFFNPQGGAYFKGVNAAFGKRGGDGGALGRQYGGQSIIDSYNVAKSPADNAAFVQVNQAGEALSNLQHTGQGKSCTGDRQTNRGEKAPKAIQDGTVK